MEPAPTPFVEAYRRYAPLLYKLAVRRFGIPRAEAECLIHDVFISYCTNHHEVNAVGPYLVSGFCDAARLHLRTTSPPL